MKIQSRLYVKSPNKIWVLKLNYCKTEVVQRFYQQIRSKMGRGGEQRVIWLIKFTCVSFIPARSKKKDSNSLLNKKKKKKMQVR